MPATEYGVSSFKSSLPIGDGVLDSTLFIEGDAQGGRACIYDFATSTGEPSPLVTCIKKHLGLQHKQLGIKLFDTNSLKSQAYCFMGKLHP